MTIWRFAVGAGWGVALGLIVALLSGPGRQASVELWVVFVAGWLAWMVMGELLAVVPVTPERLRGVWAWRRTRSQPAPQLRPLSLVEGLVLSARDNERAMARRLRPRLATVTHHFLRTRHGLDPDAHPDRVAAVLGDLMYLVDVEAEPRKLEVADLDRLLDLLIGDDPNREGER
jgi:hypothetical protein